MFRNVVAPSLWLALAALLNPFVASPAKAAPLAPEFLSDFNNHVLTMILDIAPAGSAIRFRTNLPPQFSGNLLNANQPATNAAYTRVSDNQGVLQLDYFASLSNYRSNQITLFFNTATAGTFSNSFRLSGVSFVQSNLGAFSLTAGTNIRPIINFQTPSQLVRQGNPASVSVGAMGFDLAYQWRTNGVDVAGAQNSFINFNSFQAADAAAYRVVVSNPVGSITSPPTVLALSTNITITRQPQSVEVPEGSYVEMSIGATGSIVGYNWLRNGGGALGPAVTTNATYIIPVASAAYAGRYSVQMGGVGETVTSMEAILTIKPAVANSTWLGRPFVKVADDATAVPGATGARFTNWVSPGNTPLLTYRDGTVHFAAGANVTNLGRGIFRWRTGALETLVFTNTIAPDGDMFLNTYYPTDEGNGRMDFTGGTPTTFGGVYGRITNGTLSPLLTSATPVPNRPDYFFHGPGSLSRRGAGIAIGSSIQSATASGAGVWFHNGTSLTRICDDTSDLPGVVGGYGGRPGLNAINYDGNTIVFSTITVTPTSAGGMYKSTPTGTITKLIDSTDTEPNSTNLFNSFGDIDVDGGRIFAIANNSVVGFDSSGGITNIANGALYISAAGANEVYWGNSSSVRRWKDGSNSVVLSTASVIDCRRVSQILGLDGQGDDVAVTIRFTDGSAGIFVVNGATPTQPQIVNQPFDLSVLTGTNATLAVTAAGQGPLRYQWRRNGTAIAGATNATITITNVQSGNAGNYSVVVTDVDGQTATSRNAVVSTTVPPVPVFVTAFNVPVATFSSNVTLTANAAGAAPLRYYWFRDGVLIPNVTGPTLSLVNLGVTDHAAYSVIASNANGTANSGASTLALLPVITQQPQPIISPEGSTVTFTANAAGVPPLTYQWYKEPFVLQPGQTGLSLSLTNVSGVNTGRYFMRVTSAGNGIADSARAALSIGDPPRAPMITQDPQSQTVTNGDTATLTVVATGAAPLSYQWRKGTANIAGATNASFAIANSRTNDSGNYSVVVTNSLGAATSMVATLTVIIAPTRPMITMHPTNRTVMAGQTATFAVAATGTPPLHYQWMREGLVITGATNPVLMIVSAFGIDEGLYCAVVMNAYGSATSAVARLTVAVPPSITRQPTNHAITLPRPLTEDDLSDTALRGKLVRLTIQASTNATLVGRTYELLLLANTNRYNIPSGGTLGASSGFWLSTSDPAGAILGFSGLGDAGNTLLGTDGRYAIGIDPFASSNLVERGTFVLRNADQTPVGPAVAFVVGGGGTPPVGYQWLYNGRPITTNLPNVIGVNSNRLVITSASPAHAGTYSVIVTNRFGRVTSQPATLTINGSTVPDAAPPVVTVTSPSAPVTRQLTNTVTLTGTARDNLGIAAVFAQVGSGDFGLIPGGTNWSANFPLDPGTNVFRVKARDLSGLDSLPVTRVVVYAVSNTLALGTNGLGMVMGATNGQRFEIGRNVVLTAAPKQGHLFSNWVGSVTSSSPMLVFRMVSNATLTANFVPNPFLGLRGMYQGLFYDPEAEPLSDESAGAFSINVTDKGAFTGKLQHGAATYPLSGAFGLDLASRVRVPRRGTNDLLVSLFLAAARDTIGGSVSNASWVSPLNGYRAIFDARTRPATNFAGKYNVLLAADTNEPAPVRGLGYGSVMVTPAGSAMWITTLGDGTPVMQTAPLGSRGEFPLYASLYRGLGSIFGWVNLLDTATNDVASRLLWTKRGGVRGSPLYIGGFTNDLLTLGSRYTAPARGVRALDVTNAVVIVGGGNLPALVTNTVTLDTLNRVAVTSSNLSRLALTLTPASGQLAGGFTHPATSRPAAMKGVLLQKQKAGGGSFLGTNQSGAVYFGLPENFPLQFPSP